MKYRPEIDGLRAIAVMPVILFHAGLNGFSGGFVGVDVFFVISGYLITSILLHDLEKQQFSILKFYERRARRIIPALTLVVLCCIPFAWIWMLPSELEDFGLSLAGVAAFSSNILFWQQSGYFNASSELKPMLHTWSLAVEEQYYIFFPLFLWLVWHFRKNLVLTSLFVLSIASLVLAQWASHNMPTGNYYLAPMRAWEILAGSICTVFFRRNFLRPSNIASAFGIGLVLYSMVFFTSATPTPSMWTLIPVGGTALVIMFARENNLVASILGNTAFVGIGLISYSAYLWHQPLFAFYRLRTVDEPRGIALVTLILATFAMAWFSWRFVEKPFRASSGKGFSQNQILSMGSLTLVGMCAFGLTLSALDGVPYRKTPTGERFSDMETIRKSLRPNPGLDLDCDSKWFSISQNCRSGPNAKTVLWGDSYAMHLAPALVASDTKADFIQITKSSCGPFPGLSIDLGKTRWEQCTKFNDDALNWISNAEGISTVIMSSAFLQVLNPTYTRDGAVIDSDEVSNRMVQNILDTQRYLRNHGKSILIVSPPPQNGRSLGRCFVRHRVVGRPPDECNFNQDEMTERNIEITKILKQVEKDVPVIWIDDFICDEKVCQTAMNQISIYRDSGHLSVQGSAALGRRVNLMGIVQQETSGPR